MMYIYFLGNSLVFCYTQCYYVWSRQRQRYYSVLVNSASEKPVCIFHVKILHLKKRSESQKEAEKQENRLFYFIMPLHRDRVVSKYKKDEVSTTFDILNHQPLPLLGQMLLLLLVAASQSDSLSYKRQQQLELSEFQIFKRDYLNMFRDNWKLWNSQILVENQ